MGLGEFISKRIFKHTLQHPVNPFFQIGFIRFSNDTYGFPLKTMHYMKETILNLILPYFEYIMSYFTIIIPYLTFIMSYIRVPYDYLQLIVLRILSILMSRSMQIYRYLMIFVGIIHTKYTATIIAFTLLNVQFRVAILVLLTAVILVSAFFVFKKGISTLFFIQFLPFMV